MWRKYFVVTQFKTFVVPKIGEFNVEDDNIPVEKIKAAYEATFSNGTKKCPFIYPTEEGYKAFYPNVQRPAVNVSEITIKKTTSRTKK